jgi:hypothetical protein
LNAPRNAAVPGRETGDEGSTYQAGRPSLRLQAPTHDVTDDIPAPHELSARGWEIASAYLETGIVIGIGMGRQQLEDEWRGRMEVSAAIARQIATAGPWDELADRRAAAGTGRPDQGALQRQILRDRGIQ